MALVADLLIVSGLPCAGKTILGQYLTHYCGYSHVEASPFMRRLYQDSDQFGQVSVDEFAEAVLERDPCAVPKCIATDLAGRGSERELRVVVTGFRAIGEVNCLLRLLAAQIRPTILYVEACQEIRFRRCVERGRDLWARDRLAFRAQDRRQHGLGLTGIGDDERVVRVKNESTPEEYFARVVELFRAKEDEVASAW